MSRDYRKKAALVGAVTELVLPDAVTPVSRRRGGVLLLVVVSTGPLGPSTHPLQNDSR